MRSVKVKEIKGKCSCGKGYRSRLDALCEKCRAGSSMDKFVAFWDEVEAKGVRERDWKFQVLRQKHFGVVYEITD